MAKNRISDYSLTAADNTDIAGIGILGTNNVRNFDDAFRTIMAHLAGMNKGTAPVDDSMRWCDTVDNTKIFRFDAGGVSANTTRVFQVPNLAGTLAILNLAQTWSQKQTYTLGISLGVALPISDGGTGAENAADALDNLGAVPETRTITAGLGLIGAGDLSSNITIDMGTPGTLSNTSTNDTTGSSHTHAFDQTYAGVYTGSNVSQTSYPIGTIVVLLGLEVNRNASAAVYLDPATTDFGTSGTPLSGTWRGRGRTSSGNTLMQRTA
jgi:hypothetical protein